MKSFLVVGLGRFGMSLARELYMLGHEVLGIDANEEIVYKCVDQMTHAVVGDAKDETVLRSIGVRNFDCAIVAVANDIQDSVLVTLMLKEMGVKEVVAKAQSDLHKKVLERIGADRVVFPEHEMGLRLAQSLSASNVINFLELSPDYGIAEIKPPREWTGKTLRDLDVRAKYGINILAARDAESELININPPADYSVKDIEILVVVGNNDDVRTVTSL